MKRGRKRQITDDKVVDSTTPASKTTKNSTAKRFIVTTAVKLIMRQVWPSCPVSGFCTTIVNCVGEAMDYIKANNTLINSTFTFRAQTIDCDVLDVGWNIALNDATITMERRDGSACDCSFRYILGLD